MKYLELKRELEKLGIETHNSINYKKSLEMLESQEPHTEVRGLEM